MRLFRVFATTANRYLLLELCPVLAKVRFGTSSQTLLGFSTSSPLLSHHHLQLNSRNWSTTRSTNFNSWRTFRWLPPSSISRPVSGFLQFPSFHIFDAFLFLCRVSSPSSPSSPTSTSLLLLCSFPKHPSPFLPSSSSSTCSFLSSLLSSSSSVFSIPILPFVSARSSPTSPLSLLS